MTLNIVYYIRNIMDSFRVSKTCQILPLCKSVKQNMDQSLIQIYDMLDPGTEEY